MMKPEFFYDDMCVSTELENLVERDDVLREIEFILRGILELRCRFVNAETLTETEICRLHDGLMKIFDIVFPIALLVSQ